MTRSELRAVLSPPGSITPQADLAVALALQYRWNVAPASGSGAASQQSTRTIFTPPVVGDVELALFAHEGGHILDEYADSRLHDTFAYSLKGEAFCRVVSIEAEVVAWHWAIRQLRGRWNRAMQDCMTTCLQGYARGSGRGWVAVNAVIAVGHEQADHVVRLQPSMATAFLNTIHPIGGAPCPGAT